MKKLPAIAQQLRLIADQLDSGVSKTELDDIIDEPFTPEPAVTPTVHTDEYEFEVQDNGPHEPAGIKQITCTHGHQKLVGNELRCANCDTLLQVTGIIGKTVTASQAEWAQKAAEGTPDGPNREGT